jgi:carbamoyltransferase
MWNSVTQYHPRIGHTFMPSVRSRVPSQTGGYLIRTNRAGFRSEREFVPQRTPGKRRILLFGDSQTAGDGVGNTSRYSDLLETLVPELEVYNFGLTATAPDQHFLTYQDFGSVEHDLIVIGMHVENINRVGQRYFPFKNQEGEEVLYAKPYFEIVAGQLELHHVPVPKQPKTRATLSADEAKFLYEGVRHVTLRRVITKLGMRDLAQKVTRFQPVPDYDSPDNPNWLLMRKIFIDWFAKCQVPVLVFLIPMWPYTEETSDPSNCLARFHELSSEVGCHLHDPLPDLWKYPLDERKGFRYEELGSHFSPAGHAALAKSLAPVVERILATA